MTPKILFILFSLATIIWTALAPMFREDEEKLKCLMSILWAWIFLMLTVFYGVETFK